MVRSQRPRDKARFQVVSDLHLEIGKQYLYFNIPPRADRLILAGDTGRLADYEPFCSFLKSTCENFVQVFLVLGNHEFFGLSRQEGLEIAKRLEREPGLRGVLVVMNRKRIDLDDQGIPITILGCTLQSYVPPAARETVRQKIDDFRRIVDWTVEDHCEEHAIDLAWLNDEIDAIRNVRDGAGRKILVITHHAPSTTGTSDPTHEDNPWSSAFGTDLLGNTEQQPSELDSVQVWVFGHTHYCTDMMKGEVRLVANQRGYLIPEKGTGDKSTGLFQTVVQKLRGNGKPKRLKFDVDKVIEI